jgi:hypothetical protein
MSKLLRQNIGGIDYTMVGCTLTGVCASAASDYVKSVTLSDGDVLSDGMSVVVTFANGNTAGTAPASLTIYSSDQVNYYSDSGLTQPFTLAPAGCYDIEYTGTGNAYTYISYPVIQIGEVSAPLCDSCGKKTSGAVWDAGDAVLMVYTGSIFMTISGLTNSVTTGSKKAVTSGGVAGALNNPLIKIFSNSTANDKIIHLGHFTIPSNFNRRCGLNIEIEAKRADGSYRILGSVMTQSLKIGIFDTNSQINIHFYKTNDNNYDLYLFIGAYIEQVFVKMTEPLYFTYDGSVVTSYAGTKINPIYSNSIDSVTSGNLQPVTSNAVWNNFLSKYKQTKVIHSDVNATLTLSASGFYCNYLLTLARDKNEDVGIGILYWNYGAQLEIIWLRQPQRYTVTLTKLSILESTLSIDKGDNVVMSILDLNGSGLLSLT